MSQHYASQHCALTAGIDLGDRYSHLCLLDTENGEVIEEGRIATNRQAFERRFSGAEPMRVAIEVSTHSPWVSRILEDHGHEVLVANARKVRLIYGEGRKTDRIDAEKLARLARLDPELLSPIKHRGESSQCHLALLHSRDALVGTRTKLVTHVRGTVKAFGSRLPKCTAQSFHQRSPSTCPRSSYRP
jgi:transposase